MIAYLLVFDMGVLEYFVRFFLLRKDMNWLTMGVAFLDYYWHKKAKNGTDAWGNAFPVLRFWAYLDLGLTQIVL